MTKKELIEKLAEYPDDYPIVHSHSNLEDINKIEVAEAPKLDDSSLTEMVIVLS